MFTLIVYGLVRLVDIAIAGKLPLIVDGTWQSAFFIVEIALMVIIPIVFLGVSRLRTSNCGLWVATLAAVVGLGFDRANIAGIMLAVEGPRYTPTIFEILISMAIVSGAILAFLFAVERFKIWGRKWEDPRENPDSPPDFDRTAEVWLGTPRISGRTVYSLLFVISLAVGFAIIPDSRIKSEGIVDVPVRKARGGDTLYIDGNLDGYGVTFQHEDHIARNGDKESCVLCHHMNIPNDKESGCYNCHRDMYQSADAFRHDWHASPDGANVACTECHADSEERLAETAEACDKCHSDLIPAGATIAVEQYMADSYTDAMHGVCVECHDRKAEEMVDKPDLGLCITCHKTDRPDQLADNVAGKYMHPYFNHVVLPRDTLTTEGQ